jgi:adenosylmethionine-8-amino-7-oxononanoate aminotransferase
MAAGDSGFFHDRFRPWCFPADHFPAPLCREWNGQVRAADAAGSLRALAGLLEAQADRTACLILEPSVQGAAGMRLQPPGFLAAVAGLCRQHGVHLILDEVFVGFGRLGPMLVCAAEGVTPDFLCLAKGLTGGYLPLAATLAREEIFAAFLGSHESRRAFYHGHTFTGNPLAAAVALENIRKLRPLIAGGELRRRIAVFGRLLDRAFAGHPAVSAIRQRGLAAAIDLALPSPPSARRAGLRVSLRAREHGLLLRPLGDSLLLVPPLCLTDEELGQLADRTLRAIDDVRADPAP